MASNLTYPVYVGVWTNWSQGRVLGARITLDQQGANLLIAFVAFYITLVTSSTWRIACFVLHWYYSSRRSRDALHHQRQRSRAKNVYSRLLPAIAYVTFLVVGFTLAAGFSSKVAVDDQVLISSPHCGMWTIPEDTPVDIIQAVVSSAISQELDAAVNYAQQCYLPSQSFTTLNCGTFVQNHVNTTVKLNATCPFDQSICSSQDSNIELDTGYLDTHKIFGLNAPLRERFLWRKKVRCAPLRTDGFSSSFTDSLNQSYTRYSYGDNLSEKGINYTYVYRDTISASNQTSFSAYTSGIPDYTLGSYQAVYQSGQLITDYSTFAPDPYLFGNDSDIVLAFLSANEITFVEPTLDAWFKATKPAGTYTYTFNQNQAQVYRQNEAASPLACTQQYQICSPNLPKDIGCSILGSSNDVAESAQALYKDHDDLERLNWFTYIYLQGATLITVLGDMGSNSLRAKKTLNYGSQAHLATNQWQIEVQYWHDITMASLQKWFLTTAVGSTDTIGEWISPPSTKVERTMCHSQKIQTTAYTSFSLFGLLVVLLLGGLIVLLSVTIEKLMACIQRVFKLSPYAHLEWAVNSAFQLQRLAHEELGPHQWTGGARWIPRVDGYAELGVLDLTDERHPRLQQPTGCSRMVTET
ncbi:hypothetical protein F5Y19DRAFT_466563 [Xylariaceae sp. FL1651]|nr:hypothetical protein F5Y19DRAFT_466563 [Xylariaceae sp. FL1651]